MERYFKTSKEFYDTALSYFEAWNKHNEDLLKLSCLLLDMVPTRENFDSVIDLLSSECEVLTVNPDEHFDGYTYLRGYLSQKGSEWFRSNPPSKKLSEVCVRAFERKECTACPYDEGCGTSIVLAWQQCIH
jgi:hypothetical protein